MFDLQFEDKLHKIPLRITDTTLRDAHQSIWATRMRTADITDIIDTVDEVGYYSLECWGGATFDVCLRFLREDPWERLRLIKSAAKRTPLQMLLRGQNLVGYKNYGDDVVDKFVGLAVRNGIDIFRIFDALNDSRNLEASIRAVKRYDAHAQGCLAYTVSPVHTLEKYVKDAKEQVQMGIDSLCIKDMAGILSPISAEKLITALIKEIDVPIQLHTHGTSGMGIASYVEGVRAGAGAIDCCVSSMALATAQPPVETLVAIFKETNYSANINLEAVSRVASYFKDLHPRRMQKSEGLPLIDPDILIHQIPGGMISNFRSQLAQQDSLGKLNEVLREVSEVRRDFGYPPLVTPTSQIVGTQAVLNVIAGERYKMVPNEVKDYVRGMYGRSPATMENDFISKILEGGKQIDHRPADDIAPVLDKITDDIDPKFISGDEDILSYAIFPEVAKEYFKWRSLPQAEREMSPADKELVDSLNKEQQNACSAVPKPVNPLVHNDDYQGIGHILSQANGISFDEFIIKKGDFSLLLKTGSGVKQELPVIPTEQPKSEPEKYSKTIDSPIAGTFYRAPGPGKPKFVEVGQAVSAGSTVCTVEAMKLFNEIKAPDDCTVVAILVSDGEIVQKGQALIAVK